jgi:hypothetical protein
LSFTQIYNGRAYYRTFQRYGPLRLVVAVECCLDGLPNSIVALLDTGAEWSLLPTDVARVLGCSEEYDNWFGPIVIGWSGCLEGFRFALDPTPGHEHFYFGLYAEV